MEIFYWIALDFLLTTSDLGKMHRVELKQGWRFCISNELPDDTDVAGPQTVLGVIVLEGLGLERKGLVCMKKIPGFWSDITVHLATLEVINDVWALIHYSRNRDQIAILQGHFK